eukprot:TRINITY_DN19125_c0_g1_i2.p1 TRINITY_DN19125_c0_g1~~TRINITY_DN19125_c0_g1_i2.p1  ORF type:complete len:281 (-),score=47.10 TRINITY_DN19125_c0_g1_i2:9-851(-)
MKRKRGSEERGGRQRCSFGGVEIREYNIVMSGGGGIPSEGGPPLGLGWDVVNESSVSLAEFEQARIGVRSPREVYMSEGYLSSRQRSRILKQVGHSKKEIKKAAKKVEEVVTGRWELNTVRADNWLFDANTPASALEVANDLGFEPGEVKVLDATRWSRKSAILDDLAKLLGQACSSQQIWREVRTGCKLWFRNDCAFVIKCPSSKSTQPQQSKAANKARSRVSRFVDCLATCWQDQDTERDENDRGTEPTRLLSISYAVFCLKKKKHKHKTSDVIELYS